MPCIPNCLKKSKKNKQIFKKKTDTTAHTTTHTATDTTYNVSKLIARRHSLGARPLSEIPLAGGLLKLATEVWNKRDMIQEPGDVYKIYLDMDTIANPQILASDMALTQYFRNMLLLGTETGIDTSLQIIQMPFHCLVTSRENYLRHRLPISAPRLRLKISNLVLGSAITIENYLLMVMATEFLGFYTKTHNKDRHAVKYRVYLNINTNNNTELSSATHIMSFVVREILHKINGVVFAKIALAARVDSIIIFTTNIHIADKVIAKLYEYQNANGISGFNCAIPVMSKSQIYGVTTASEPPQVIIEKCQLRPSNRRLPLSFGTFRTDLIYNALKDSTESYDFYELIVKYFRNTGIDAHEPAIQIHTRSCLMEAQRNLVEQIITNTTRL